MFLFTPSHEVSTRDSSIRVVVLLPHAITNDTATTTCDGGACTGACQWHELISALQMDRSSQELLTKLLLMGQGATSTRPPLSREARSFPVDTGAVIMWQGYNESWVNMSVASSLWSVPVSYSTSESSWTTTKASRGRGRHPGPEAMSGRVSLKVEECFRCYTTSQVLIVILKQV